MDPSKTTRTWSEDRDAIASTIDHGPGEEQRLRSELDNVRLRTLLDVLDWLRHEDSVIADALQKRVSIYGASWTP